MKKEKLINICNEYEKGDKSLLTLCNIVVEVYNDEEDGNLDNAINDVELISGQGLSKMWQTYIFNNMKFVKKQEIEEDYLYVR